MRVKNLYQMLGEPTVDNSVTFAQYVTLDKKLKTEKKAAAGNWNFGVYEGERRKKGQLKGRYGLVFDFDHASEDQIEDIRAGLAEICRWDFHLHTTRSHSADQPRWRLTMPFNRMATCEEAYAINRLVTKYLADDEQEGVDMVDAKSFDNNQVMFRPSISKGQEFLYDRNVGELFDVDVFLADHPEWQDTLVLPFQTDEKKREYDPDARMEDPRDKPNPIGPFCRAYTVENTIAQMIPDTYVPDDQDEGRYRYAPADGASGAVVMDGGLFLQSFHANDPAEGQHNAFDLVRIHMFGHLDKDVREGTSPMNWPSTKAMIEYANGLDEVVAEQYAAMDEVVADMDDLDDLEEESSTPDDLDEEAADLLGIDDLDDLSDEPKKEKKEPDWRTNFRRKGVNGTGGLDTSLNNAALIAMNDKRVAPCIGYNEFTKDPVCFKPIRAPKIDTPAGPVAKRDRKRGRRWEDGDDISFALIASGNEGRGGYEVDFAQITIQQAVLAAGKQNPVNPVKDDIEDCWRRWKAEGSPTGNLDTYGIRYLKLPDTPFHRESPAMYLVASVARTYEPGCKCDWMPVIEGTTGSGKSTFYQELFLEEFVTELKSGLDDTGRLIEQTRAYRMVELAEMTAAKKVDSNTLKMQLSSARDVHRLAYGKREMEFARQFLFGGTSNDDDYLTDPTSTRRFHVWRTPLNKHNRIDRDGLRAERHLLWGEAYQRYLDMREENPDGHLFLDLDGAVADERDALAEQSRKRTVPEEIAAVVEEWLDRPHRICDVMLGADGMTLDEYEGDETLVVRNMVTANEAFVSCRHEKVLQPYGKTDPRTYGKALKYVRGWEEIGRVKRHGSAQVVRYARDVTDNRLWVPVGDQAKEDDLLD